MSDNKDQHVQYEEDDTYKLRVLGPAYVQALHIEGDYGPDGWRGLVDDGLQLIRKVREEHAGPVLIMGHSMGSMIVQHLLTEASDLLDVSLL